MNRFRGWRAIGVTLAVVLCLSVSIAALPRLVNAQAIGSTPIRLALASLKGDTIRIGIGAPTTVVAVFATWCRGCKEEVALLNRLQTEFEKSNVRLVALSGDESSNDHVQRWLDNHHAAYPVVRDPSGGAFRAIGVVGVPEMHVITSEGVEVFVQRGPIESHLAALRSAVQAIRPTTTR